METFGSTMFLFPSYSVLLTPYSIWSRAVLSVNLWRTVSNHRSQTIEFFQSPRVGCVSSDYLNCAETEKLKRYPMEWIHPSLDPFFSFSISICSSHTLSELPSGDCAPLFHDLLRPVHRMDRPLSRVRCNRISPWEKKKRKKAKEYLCLIEITGISSRLTGTKYSRSSNQSNQHTHV